MRIEVQHRDDCPLVDDLYALFVQEFKFPRAEVAPIVWHVLVWDDSAAEPVLASHVGILTRTGTVDDAPVELAGIACVYTYEAFRGRGFGSAAMRRAHDFVREETAAEFGLLACEDHRLTFYAGLGWQRVSGPTTVNWQGTDVITGLHTMILPLRDHAWPQGAVNLCGKPW